VVLTAGVLIAFFATSLMRRIVDSGAHLFAALLVALLSVGRHPCTFLRGPMFTLALLSISMGIVEADRRGAKSRADLVLVPLTLVWTNLHGGFLI